jgi:glycerol-3-phosphate acyltransferase PlsY
MLIMAGPAILTLLIKKNVTLANAVLFIPLSLVCWWLKVPGILIAYSVALPCLVGLTHLLRARRVIHPVGTGRV